MLNDKYLKSLATINKIMMENDIKWCVVGSTNLALHKMPVSPKDLDIVVLKKDMEKIKEIFTDYTTGEITEKKYNDRFALELALKMNSVEIQIMGEDEQGLYTDIFKSNNFEYINIKNNAIPVRPLKLEAETYKKTKRDKKARAIEFFLSGKKSATNISSDLILISIVNLLTIIISFYLSYTFFKFFPLDGNEPGLMEGFITIGLMSLAIIIVSLLNSGYLYRKNNKSFLLYLLKSITIGIIMLLLFIFSRWYE